MSEQLALSLPVRAASGREDFIVAPAMPVRSTALTRGLNGPIRCNIFTGPPVVAKATSLRCGCSGMQHSLCRPTPLTDGESTG